MAVYRLISSLGDPISIVTIDMKDSQSTTDPNLAGKNVKVANKYF